MVFSAAIPPIPLNRVSHAPDPPRPTVWSIAERALRRPPHPRPRLPVRPPRWLRRRRRRPRTGSPQATRTASTTSSMRWTPPPRCGPTGDAVDIGGARVAGHGCGTGIRRAETQPVAVGHPGDQPGRHRHLADQVGRPQGRVTGTPSGPGRGADREYSRLPRCFGSPQRGSAGSWRICVKTVRIGRRNRWQRSCATTGYGGSFPARGSR